MLPALARPLDNNLGTPRRRFAGAERGSRVLQFDLKVHCERVRATEHAPRGPFCVLECRHGLAEFSELGAIGHVERPCVIPIHPKHPMTFEIRASLKLCFDEQLDWTLGDFPQQVFEDLAEILRPTARA